MKKSFIIEMISFLLVLLFLYASFSKLFDLPRFRLEMNRQPFPVWLKPVLFAIVPVTEILVAGLLIAQRTRLAGLYGSFVLMALFTGYTIVILLHLIPKAPCSCGGIIRSLSWWQHLLFNTLFLLLSFWGIRLQKPDKRSSSSMSIA